MTEPWSSKEEQIKKLDFSQFHATADHWPWTRYCREQYGGGWHHLKLAWEYHRRDQWFWWWFRATGCWRGRHRESVWRTRTAAGVMCLYCSWTRTPSEKELDDFPRFP